MSQAALFQHPIRKECPPGACGCDREQLMDKLGLPAGRILMLTREAEKGLIDRIARIDSYEDLLNVSRQMQVKLGIVLTIAPATEEVRTVRGGLDIRLAEQPGLCRKTQQTIPAAIRKCLEQHPAIVYALLDADGLFGTSPLAPAPAPAPAQGA